MSLEKGMHTKIGLPWAKQLTWSVYFLLTQTWSICVQYISPYQVQMGFDRECAPFNCMFHSAVHPFSFLFFYHPLLFVSGYKMLSQKYSPTPQVFLRLPSNFNTK